MSSPVLLLLVCTMPEAVLTYHTDTAERERERGQGTEGDGRQW